MLLFTGNAQIKSYLLTYQQYLKVSVVIELFKIVNKGSIFTEVVNTRM